MRGRFYLVHSLDQGLDPLVGRRRPIGDALEHHELELLLLLQTQLGALDGGTGRSHGSGFRSRLDTRPARCCCCRCSIATSASALATLLTTDPTSITGKADVD